MYILERAGNDPALLLIWRAEQEASRFTPGINVYGIDASMDMLSVAQEKAAEAGCQFFSCQKMQWCRTCMELLTPFFAHLTASIIW